MSLSNTSALVLGIVLLGACSASTSPQPTATSEVESDAGATTPSPSAAQAPAATTNDATAPLPAGPAFRVEIDSLAIDDRAAPGGQSTSYELERDGAVLVDGQPSARLSAIEGATKTTWAATTATYDVNASIAGRRYRMRAKIKTEDATAAFLWWRIDGPGFFDLDNMGNPVDRRIRGTHDWQEVTLVLDVPAGATRFAFGSGLTGKGKVWVGAFSFDAVGSDVQPTPHFSEE